MCDLLHTRKLAPPGKEMLGARAGRLSLLYSQDLQSRMYQLRGLSQMS